MDHDYELEDEYAPRILWGRLAFFLLALILAFVAGRACAPNGVDQDEFEAVQSDVFELSSEKARLEQQLDAQEDAPPDTGGKNNGGGKGKNQGNGGAEDEPTASPSEEVSADGETYTVQTNDTLTTIAEQFYGDPTMFDLIVDANNLSEDTPLRVGQELIIPPAD